MSKNIFNKTFEILTLQKLKIVDKDIERPWGGFFVISENNSQDFANIYFNGLNTEDLKISGKLSPKILIIAPNKRLSWQYHHRRSEIWKVNTGKIKVVTSHDDIERKEILLKGNLLIFLLFPNSVNKSKNIGSTVLKISSCSTKDISISS